MSGKVTHVRCYKVPEETGSHVGRIWSDTGAQLVQQPFAGETTSGWQEVQLTTPLQITAGVRYRVSHNVNSEHSPVVFVGGDQEGTWVRAYGLSGPTVTAKLIEEMAGGQTAEQLR